MNWPPAKKRNLWGSTRWHAVSLLPLPGCESPDKFTRPNIMLCSLCLPNRNLQIVFPVLHTHRTITYSGHQSNTTSIHQMTVSIPPLFVCSVVSDVFRPELDHLQGNHSRRFIPVTHVLNTWYRIKANDSEVQVTLGTNERRVCRDGVLLIAFTNRLMFVSFLVYFTSLS